jgi:hypothetical protein
MLLPLNRPGPVTLTYRIYGLNLSSDSAIPGLRHEPDEPPRCDLCVELRAEPEWVRDALRLPSLVLQSIPACSETQDPAFLLTSFGEREFFQLAYSDGTRFVVNGAATRIWGAPGESQTMEDLSTYFLGPIMGFILRRRGVTALHASAVCVDGKAIVLTGAAGAGKSTSAAALALRGESVLCEDIAAIEEKDGDFAVEAGYPRVCLWPESVEMLRGRADALPQLSPNWEKCFLALDGFPASFETRKSPLGAIYILAPRETAANAPRLEDVGNREMLLELVQNTYMNWLLDRSQRAAEFTLLARLVSRIPIRRIVPHRHPSRIGALCELIVTDARRLLANEMSAAHTAGR